MSQKNNAITLLGMSGAGKTHFSQRLATWGWDHYSCDFEIAKRLGIDVKVDDLSALSNFIGKVGAADQGGLSLHEFKRRQTLYYEAECEALRNVATKITHNNFVNDSTGSFCEITDEGLIAQIAQDTILVYIESDPSTHTQIIDRAKLAPKPLFYPADRLDDWLDEYCQGQGVTVDTMSPDDFAAWVFPKLFASRLPKYDALVQTYGVKIAATDLHAIESEQEFITRITTGENTHG